MKRFLILLVAACQLLMATPGSSAPRLHPPVTASSQHPLGLGIILGEPTGLTAKYWLDPHAAIDPSLAFSLNDYFLLYCDYLYHFETTPPELKPYIGGGLMVLFQTGPTGNNDRTYFRSDQGSTGLSLRIPLGMEWRPATLPIGVFGEVAPGMGVIPTTYGLIQGGIGVRYYF